MKQEGGNGRGMCDWIAGGVSLSLQAGQASCSEVNGADTELSVSLCDE